MEDSSSSHSRKESDNLNPDHFINVNENSINENNITIVQNNNNNLNNDS